MGFQQLQAIREETLKGMLEERDRNGPFVSLEDFLRRVSLPPGDGAVLVKSGALDSLAGGLNRPQLLWAVEAWLREHPRAGEKDGQILPFSTGSLMPVPPLPDVDRRRLWRHEEQTLGFMLSAHPLTVYEPFVRSLDRPVTPASRLAGHVGKRVRVLGWPVTRKEVLTMEGEPMVFVTFEDASAIYETVMFPDAFRRFCQQLDMNRPYLISARVERDLGAVSLTIENLRRIPLPQTPANRVGAAA